MADLLVYSPDDGANLLLNDLALRHDYRVKSTSDLETANKWLELRSFDLLFIHASTAVPVQQAMAGKLWEHNPSSPVYMFDLQSQSEKVPYARLFGAEIALGDGALDILERALTEFKKNRFVPSSEFNIMIVEDLDSPREIISIFLENMGYSNVKGFSSAQAALEALNAGPKQFSCIITDIRMPRMTGQQLIEEVRKDQRFGHLPIIVLTAYGTVDCLIDCLEAGATGFLVKPPKGADMQREVRRAQRVFSHRMNPRLASEQDIESVRSVILDRGL
ncbi:MAG: response regulator [Bdellovibrionales bacterium]|nr:response regulator [Bdellovibrionales bacterium]